MSHNTGDVQQVLAINEVADASHNGRAYRHMGAANILAGASLDHLFKTPANVYVELSLASVDSDTAPLSALIYEAPTVTAEGTLHASNNIKRYTTKIASTQVYHGPTITTLGTLIDGFLLSGSKQTGSGSVEGFEWLLKPNTYYLIRLTNGAVGAANVIYKYDFSEESEPEPDA